MGDVVRVRRRLSSKIDCLVLHRRLAWRDRRPAGA